MPALSARSPFRVFASVVFALWFRELKTRFAGLRLGWVWAILGPLAGVAVFALIAGTRGREAMFGIDYPVYVATGLIPFGMVTHALASGMGAVDANRGLFIYRQVKPFDVIVARVLQTACIDGIVLTVILGLGAWLGYDVLPDDPLGVMAWLLVLGCFAAGLALGAAVLGTLVAESQKVVPILMRPLIFVSGVIWPVSRLPDEWKPWLLWNPLLHQMEMLRSAWFSEFPLDDGINAGYALLAALATLALGLLAYRRWADRLAAE